MLYLLQELLKTKTTKTKMTSAGLTLDESIITGLKDVATGIAKTALSVGPNIMLLHTYLKYNGGFSTVPLLNPKFLGLSIIQEIFWTNQGSC